MSLSNLPLELFHLITDFCANLESATNFSLISRMTYHEIYMMHPRLFSTRVKRTIFYELNHAKFKRGEYFIVVLFDDGDDDDGCVDMCILVINDECDSNPKRKVIKTGNGNGTWEQFEEIANYVKQQHDFIKSQREGKSELFTKWNTYLDNCKFDKTITRIVQDEIFSKFVLNNYETVETGENCGRNRKLNGRIGNVPFSFNTYDEEGSKITWSIILGSEEVAYFSWEECFLFRNVARNFIGKLNLDIEPIELIEILMTLQPWDLNSTWERFKVDTIE